jgi:hypothetical protein
MAIRVICKCCHSSLKAPDERAGKSARCPCCKASLTVPIHYALVALPVRPPAPFADLDLDPEEVFSAPTSSRFLWPWLAGCTGAMILLVGLGIWLLGPSTRNQPEGSELPEIQEAVATLPFLVNKDGWLVTENCKLILASTPYIANTKDGKFIFTTSMAVLPAGKESWTHKIQPQEAGRLWTPGDFTQRPSLRLLTDNIPLKPSLGLQTDDGKFIIGEDNSIGPDVTTKLINKGTLIMPDQEADVTDPSGKVVFTHRLVQPKGVQTSNLTPGTLTKPESPPISVKIAAQNAQGPRKDGT